MKHLTKSLASQVSVRHISELIKIAMISNERIAIEHHIFEFMYNGRIS